MRSLESYFALLLTPTLQDYLRAHENDDVQNLLLKNRDINGIPAKYIAQLIAGRQKVKHKLPSWWNRTDLLYPPSINLEQASSEATANFKNALIASMIRNRDRAADLTGGFGIDSFFLSKTFKQVDYIERDPELFEIASRNFRTLSALNIQPRNSTAEDFVRASSEKFDLIYIDPSRRKASQKLVKLSDCEPDVTALLQTLLTKSDVILIKASPLLDIQQGISELKNVSDVCVVAVDNECKELLFVVRKGFEGETMIKAVDLRNDGSIIHEMAFKKSDEVNASIRFSAPGTFIYEPSASLLKAGAFKCISKVYKVLKLAPNTHLYTSDARIEFPGRTFKVVRESKLDKQLKGEFENGHANILTRNYPLSVEEIKKKTGLKEGGEQYLICTQDQSNKLVLIAERL